MKYIDIIFNACIALAKIIEKTQKPVENYSNLSLVCRCNCELLFCFIFLLPFLTVVL